MFAVEKSEGDQAPATRVSITEAAAQLKSSRRLVSIMGAAEQLGVSRATIYNMKSAGVLKVGKLLGKTVVAQSEIDRIIASAERGEAI